MYFAYERLKNVNLIKQRVVILLYSFQAKVI